jgi:hypothetical protein
MPDPSQETLPRHEAEMFVAVFALGLAAGALWEIMTPSLLTHAGPC